MYYYVCPEDDIYRESLWDIVKFAINQTRNPTLLSRMSREGGAC
jgi:hypothetical protein